MDAAAVKREQHLDGKVAAAYLRHHPDLSAEDLAAAYNQLLQVERGWRDMKGHLGLRPVFHHRIRAHVQLCWLALLLIRVVENATGRAPSPGLVVTRPQHAHPAFPQVTSRKRPLVCS